MNTNMADFFISAVQPDRASAEAIATHLRTAGYTVVEGWTLKQWGTLLYEMTDARAMAKRVLVVLSEAYLRGHDTADAIWWLADQHQSPFDQPETLVAVKVAPVGRPLRGHFSSPAVPLIDLTNIPLHTPGAIQALLAGIRHPGAAPVGATYALPTSGTGIALAAGGVDYYMSASPRDRAKADLLALYLSRSGVRVFRLWADAASVPQNDLEERVAQAPAMIAVLSDDYLDDPPWEWTAFQGRASGPGAFYQSRVTGKTLVMIELQDLQMGKMTSSSMKFVVIPLHDMGSRPERDERDLLVGLGLPPPAAPFASPAPVQPALSATPASTKSATPSQQPGQQVVFCHHCGAANPAGTAQCFACSRSLTGSVPSGTGSIGAPLASAGGGTGVPAAQPTATVPSFCDRCGEPNRSSALFCRSCGNPMSGPVAPAANATGLLGTQTLLGGRYRIVGQVGKGGFGAVYQVEDTQFGDRLLAVKEMSQAALSPAEVAEAVEAFKREALLLARLMDQHLPRVYEHFSVGGRWYLVMDYIEGLTLEDYLARQPGGRLPVEEALDYGQQLCDVLDYLHVHAPGAPLVFRDLKPANIMRTPRGYLYLIDFGIARHFVPGQAKDTAALGSTGYAAPEQYGKEQTTARADLYALGATLHQLLSGDDPSESPFQFRSLTQVPGLALPSGLGQLVAQLVEMDKGKRPASAALVKQALKSIAAGRGLPQALGGASGQAASPAASPATTSASSAAPASTSPVGQPAGAALCVYREHGVGGRVNAATLSPDGKRAASVGSNRTLRIWEVETGRTLQAIGLLSEYRLALWSPDGWTILTAGAGGVFQALDPDTGNTKKFPYLPSGNGLVVTALAWSPDGHRFALGKDSGVVVWSSIYASMISDYYTGHQRATRAVAVRAVACSPDGQRIVSGDEEGSVHIWDASGGVTTQARLVYRGHLQNAVQALSWSPEGSLIVSADAGGSVQVWEAATGRLVSTYTGHAGMPVRSVVFSPDGDLVASGGDDNTVQVWEPSGKVLAVYQGHTARVNTVAWSGDGSRLVSASDDKTARVWQVGGGGGGGQATLPPLVAAVIPATPPKQQTAAPASLFPAPSARPLPAIPELLKGRDEGPMDLLHWVARMLFKHPAPDTTFFSIDKSQALVRFDGSNTFVVERGLQGGPQPFQISWLADEALEKLCAALRRQGTLPEEIQGLALDYDPGVNTFYKNN